MMQSKSELKYLKRVSKFLGKVIGAHPDSKQEGFEYLFTHAEGYKGKSRIKMLPKIGHGFNLINRLRLYKMFARYQRGMMKGINDCFNELNPYIQELESEGKFISSTKDDLIQNFPNQLLWDELQDYARDKWNLGNVGFTELPTQLIFKDKSVLFPYALVFIQEMAKDKIDQAPNFPAGKEVQRIYKTLGFAVNDIANWLRDKGIRCQSNHPLGGLVNTPPLAGKAGLGWRGFNGLLITPEYGQRQRIAPVFVGKKIFEFTDNTDHSWIEQYCKKCHKCMRKCPTQAITKEKQVSIPNVPGIGATITCIDREKCFPYFVATLGCSICVQVCPFSKGPEMYEKLKQHVLKVS